MQLRELGLRYRVVLLVALGAALWVLGQWVIEQASPLTGGFWTGSVRGSRPSFGSFLSQCGPSPPYGSCASPNRERLTPKRVNRRRAEATRRLPVALAPPLALPNHDAVRSYAQKT
jgi:hypothetical protein